MDASAWKVVKIIFAILLPPLACWMQNGFQAHFWINLVVWLFGNLILPGIGHIICVGHALYVVLTDDLDTQQLGKPKS